MPRECPSCGNIVDNGQDFCSMCGTLVAVPNKKNDIKINIELESALISVNAQAEEMLAKNITGKNGKAVNSELLTMANNYMGIVERFPNESKAYMAYVDFIIKYILKINDVKNIFSATKYFNSMGDFNVIITRCKNYLSKAKEYANDEELEIILQLESGLSSKLELVDAIKLKQSKRKKMIKFFWIALGIIFAIYCLVVYLTT